MMSTTVDKALDLLFHLHGSPEPQGVTAIARAFGVPKSGVHRLLNSLLRKGLVEQAEDGRYGVGFGLVALGLGALRRDPLAAAAKPVLTERAAKMGETHFVIAARGGELVVLEKAEGAGFLRAAPTVGSAIPQDVTAAGKLFAAFAPDELSSSSRPEACAVEEARRQRWAANFDAWIPGLSVVAAPVIVRGQLEGVLALAAPSSRIDHPSIGGVVAGVVSAASQIASRLELGRPAEVRP